MTTVDEEKPLLEAGSQGHIETELANHGEHRELIREPYLILWLLFQRLFYIPLLMWTILPLSWNISSDAIPFPLIESSLHKMQQERIRNQDCSSIVASTDRQFGFNFTDDVATASRWQLLDSSIPESRKSFRGYITVDRGSSLQVSDMEVYASIRSSEEKDLENVHLHKSDSVLNIDYNFRNDSDVCTEVEILIRTSNFHVSYKTSLGWEINNLLAHTLHGSLYMDWPSTYNNPLITHNVSFGTVDGLIFGWFIPDENLQLHSEDGEIDALICPRLAEGVPFDPKSISISTVSSKIRVGLVHDVWPAKAYTHRTKIESASGKINAIVPHGALTNISSINGAIKTLIRSYAAPSPNATSEIHTSSRSGDSWVLMYSPPNESLDGNYNPLLNTFSKHEVGEGQLLVDYPFAWWGKMEGKIEHGELEFDGNSLEDVKRGKGHVTAKRGEGKSQMEAHVGNGGLNIRLGLQELD